jgi:hypothetical protein
VDKAVNKAQLSALSLCFESANFHCAFFPQLKLSTATAFDQLVQGHARQHRSNENNGFRQAHAKAAVGNFISKPNKVVLRDFAQKNAKNPTAMAPNITSISEGSQSPAKLRKPTTLAGFAMPEIISPIPNIRPARKEINIISGAAKIQ